MAGAQKDDPGTRNSFDAQVEAALQDIPDMFREAMKNISIIVEDRPGAELLRDAGLQEGDLLFGLYVGVPLPERIYGYDPLLPDVIYLFREPLMAACSTLEQLREEIRITVLHEIGHYFGFDEDDLAARGLA